MIIFKKALSRRTVLRGLGASVALPMLDSMVPALARASDPISQMPLRVGYVYSANGLVKEVFRPASAGSKFEMTAMLKHWESCRDQLLILSNMNNGDSASVSAHVGASGLYLTGVKPNKSLSEIHAGISVDQVIAGKLGKDTPLGSLQLGIEDAAELAGQSANAYSSAYTNTISWSSPTTPLPVEISPRNVFERLFGDGTSTDPKERQARIHRQYSILDYLQEETKRLSSTLGADDNTKISEYLEAVREVESRVQKAENQTNLELPEIQKPVGIPPREEHIRLMYDLLLLAFQTDMTRVFTFMYAREYSEWVFRNLGHDEPYHPLTHHGFHPRKWRQAGEIDVYHAKLFGEFLRKMKSTKDGDGSSLLDNSILVYGAGMDGNSHARWNIPVALVGGFGGKLKGGRHIEYKEGTPTSNLHVTMLNMIGIPTEKFGGGLGGSTGELDLNLPA
jgi:hypothetical protein